MDYVSINTTKENFLIKKFRNQWLNLGYQNTSFFHRLVKVRNSKNLIKNL